MRALRSLPVELRLPAFNRTLSQVILVALFLGYWLFAWQLERVDYSGAPPWVWQQVINVYPLFDILTPYVLLPAELLAPRVLRHLIPLIVGWWFAQRAIVALLQTFYDLPDRSEAQALLARLQLGSARRLKPVPIQRQDFAEQRRKDPLLRIGGPGRISVTPGDAVVTERNGRIQRVLGPGVHVLGAFEYPRAVVDVRPQERESDSVRVVTADGIDLTAELSVTFQVDPGDKTPTRGTPFPFDEEAVRRVAYLETSLAEEEIGTWDSVALAVTSGQLKDIVAEYRLDDIILPDSSSLNIHRQLNTRLARQARASLASLGIQLRGTRLGRLELDERVTDQHIKTWQAYWEGQRRIRLADGQATALEDMEAARAEGEAFMLEAIADGLEEFRVRYGTNFDRHILALRLIEALEKMARQSGQLSAQPENLLAQLSDMRSQLMLSSGDDDDG